jgi:hypothetical protein
MAAVVPESIPESLSDTIRAITSRLNEMKSPNAKFSLVDPEYEELAKTLPRPLRPPRPPIPDQRQHALKFQKWRLEMDPGPRKQRLQLHMRCLIGLSLETCLTVNDRIIKANSTDILIRTYVPESSDGEGRLYPILVWLHGKSVSLPHFRLRLTRVSFSFTQGEGSALGMLIPTMACVESYASRTKLAW